uniref:Uncharacterized protein n=1 Tax=Anopheles merus TaxID=30066 RepID=A0A182UYB0_ANOME
MVWKQECSCTRNGGLLDRARTRFSTIVHSTSSSWMMMSFFRILIAYSSSVPLRSASITLPNEPLPSTIRKLKSVARMTSFFVMLCGTSLSPIIGIFFYSPSSCVSSLNHPSTGFLRISEMPNESEPMKSFRERKQRMSDFSTHEFHEYTMRLTFNVELAGRIRDRQLDAPPALGMITSAEVRDKKM